MKENPYIDLKREIETEQASGPANPYLDLKNKDLVGTSLEPVGSTNYSRLVDARSQAEAATAEAKRENSFKTLAIRTLNPVNLAKAGWNLAKQVATDPVSSAREAALGLANGLTFGATDWLQRKAFVDEAKKNGMDEEAARSMAEAMLKPEDPELAAIRGGGNMAGLVAPYAAGEKLLLKGMAYAAPNFVMKYGKSAKLLADIGIFNAGGQIEESFKDAKDRNRALRAAIDTGTALTFFGGGEVYRRIRGTQFKSPFDVGVKQVTSSKRAPSPIPEVDNAGQVMYKWSGGEKAAHFDLFKDPNLENLPTVGRGTYYAYDPKSSQIFGDIQEKFLLPNNIKLLDMTKGVKVEPGFSGSINEMVSSPFYKQMLKDGESDMLKWAAKKGYQGVKFFADDGTHAWLALQDGLKLDPSMSSIIKKVAESEVKSNIPFVTAKETIDDAAQKAAGNRLTTMTIQRSAARKAEQKALLEAEGAASAPKPAPVEGAPAAAPEGAVVDAAIPEEAAPIAAKAEGAPADQMTIATNDMQSLQNYIKSSGKIDYKIVGKDLGTDQSGRTIVARHEFNPETGRHVIYTSDSATASNIAHELGHYFDKELSQTTMGLSRLLPDFKKNQDAIEDALGSYAVARLGGNAADEAVSKEVAFIANALVKEADVLSALRQGGSAQVKASERFADAVGEILTNKAATGQAPVLEGLLKHLDTINETDLLGKKIVQAMKTDKALASASSDVISVGEKMFKLKGEALKRYTAEAERSKSYLSSSEKMLGPERYGAVKKGEGMKMSALKRELTGEYTGKELQKMVDVERSNFVGKEVTVDINGTPTKATIASKPSFGNTKVKLADGKTVSVKNAQIAADERPGAEIVKKLIERKDAELYVPEAKAAPKKEVSGEIERKNVEKPSKATEKEVVEKEVTKELDRTPTGKKPESEAVKSELLTNDKDIEVFFNTKVLPKVTGDLRIGKSNDDIVTRSLASKMTEGDFNKILSERFGNLSEDVVKAKRLMNDKALDIVDKLAGRDVRDIPVDELGQITNEMNQIVEMFEVMAGMRTELSNSFRSLGIKVGPGENDVLRQVVGEIQRVLGKDVDGFSVAQKLLKLRENTIVDKYFTVWYPALLSGPKTTVRNVVGTGASLVTDTVSQLFSTEGRKTFSDRVSAIVGAQKQAWENAKGVFKGEESIVSKFREAPPLKEEAFSGKMGWLNKVEYVGRFLDAQDAFFSTIAKEGEVAALRSGKYTYGLDSKATINAVNDAVAQGLAKRITYRNAFDNTAVGTLGRAASTLKSSDNQAVKGFFTFIMPFVRTVANVTDRKIDYLPIANLARTFGGKIHMQRARAVARDVDLKGLLLKDGMEQGMSREAARKFAASESERVTSIIAQRLKQQQMGKMFMGLSVTAGMMPMAMAGRITGAGPKDKNERDTLMQKGWRPQSIILPGGVVLPYQNLGPMAGLLSLMGNISDAVKYGNEDEKGVTNMFWSGIDNFLRGELDQSFVSGISGIYDAIYGFKEFDQLVAEMAANAVPIPAAWSQSKDILFPERFEAKGFLESIQNRLGATGGLEPKLNAFGEQYGADLIWGLTPKMLNTDDKVLNWMDENNVFVGKPQKATKINGRRGESREMTPEEYTRYVEASGKAIYRELNTKIVSGYFNRLKSEEEKKKAVQSITSDIREVEKRKFRF